MYLEDKNLMVEPGLRPLNEVALTLLRAADLIRNNGHAKKSLKTHDGRHCALGAICVVANGSEFDLTNPAQAAASAMMCKLGTDIASWNNAEARTAGEVIATLEAAAYQASEGRGSNHV